jgi:hypothetical protein
VENDPNLDILHERKEKAHFSPLRIKEMLFDRSTTNAIQKVAAET